jgi:hypothetical protein
MTDALGSSGRLSASRFRRSCMTVSLRERLAHTAIRVRVSWRATVLLSGPLLDLACSVR